jgi:hypothetical protein
LLCETFGWLPSELDREDAARLTRWLAVLEQRGKATSARYKR